MIKKGEKNGEETRTCGVQTSSSYDTSPHPFLTVGRGRRLRDTFRDTTSRTRPGIKLFGKVVVLVVRGE